MTPKPLKQSSQKLAQQLKLNNFPLSTKPAVVSLPVFFTILQALFSNLLKLFQDLSNILFDKRAHVLLNRFRIGRLQGRPYRFFQVRFISRNLRQRFDALPCCNWFFQYVYTFPLLLHCVILKSSKSQRFAAFSLFHTGHRRPASSQSLSSIRPYPPCFRL